MDVESIQHIDLLQHRGREPQKDILVENRDRRPNVGAALLPSCVNLCSLFISNCKISQGGAKTKQIIIRILLSKIGKASQGARNISGFDETCKLFNFSQ